MLLLNLCLKTLQSFNTFSFFFSVTNLGPSLLYNNTTNCNSIDLIDAFELILKTKLRGIFLFLKIFYGSWPPSYLFGRDIS